jgi:sulfur oxygenase/reductase
MSKVLNKEESFNLMHKVGPRVCITTATHPGFVGFMANIQTGILPLAGRYGGGSIHMDPLGVDVFFVRPNGEVMASFRGW